MQVWLDALDPLFLVFVLFLHLCLLFNCSDFPSTLFQNVHTAFTYKAFTTPTRARSHTTPSHPPW